MPDWMLPALATLIGGGGIGAIAKAYFDRKSTAFTELKAFVDVIKTDRAEKHAENAALRSTVEKVTGAYYDERSYSASWEAWEAAGCPPPPPVRHAPPALQATNVTFINPPQPAA